MGLLEAAILGIIQGITEFLPVSSDGHLAVAHYFFTASKDNLTFDIMVHLGTAFSVVLVYRRPLLNILIDFFLLVTKGKKSPGSSLALMVLLGSVPAGFVGLSFRAELALIFANIYAAIFGFIFTGLILFLTRFHKAGDIGKNFFSYDESSKVSHKQALAIGVAQALAILPGVSRSGSTIATGILTGLSRKDAALFSFLLAVPAIFGAAILEMGKVSALSLEELGVMFVGFATSFTVGYFSLRLLLQVVQKGRVHLFSYYLWALAAGLLVYLSFGVPT